MVLFSALKSDHPLSQKWLSQFSTSYDRAQASQLLNQLTLVSTRQFETGIEQALTELQKRLKADIAYAVEVTLEKEAAERSDGRRLSVPPGCERAGYLETGDLRNVRSLPISDWRIPEHVD
jgi:hypothetical protein